MRTLTKFLTASAVAATLGAFAPAASAAVLISFNGTTALAGGTFPGPGYDFIVPCGVINCGGFGSIEVSGSTGTLPTLLHSATVDATTTAGSAADLTIWVTRTDISSADFTKFKSAFTSNNTGNDDDVTPFTVTMTTYYSASDAKFGGTELATFANNQVGAFSNNQTDPGNSGNGLYSVTEEYRIQATAFGQSESSSPTIALSGRGAVVPEPATWGLMLVGFGGMGALLRNRRRMAAVAA